MDSPKVWVRIITYLKATVFTGFWTIFLSRLLELLSKLCLLLVEDCFLTTCLAPFRPWPMDSFSILEALFPRFSTCRISLIMSMQGLLQTGHFLSAAFMSSRLLKSKIQELWHMVPLIGFSTFLKDTGQEGISGRILSNNIYGALAISSLWGTSLALIRAMAPLIDSSLLELDIKSRVIKCRPKGSSPRSMILVPL